MALETPSMTDAPDKRPIPVELLDPVRRRIIARIDELGTSRSAASLAIGRNQAYIQQYLRYGTPDKLDELDRRKLAAFLRIDEREIAPPDVRLAFGEPRPAFDESPTAPSEEPAAPYEARDLMGDLVGAIAALHEAEKMPINDHELGVILYDLHGEILHLAAKDHAGDLRAAMAVALHRRRLHLRRRRHEILTQKVAS